MGWGALIQLLLKIFGLAERKALETEAKEHEEEIKAVDRDPADWWQSNFDSVPDSSSMPNNAQSTRKADSED